MICQDTDYFALELKQSNIPKAGLGLFAKIDIPQGTILGEYRGTIIYKGMMPDLLFGKCIRLNDQMDIWGSNCAVVHSNDIVVWKDDYTDEDIKSFAEAKAFPTHPDLQYNAGFSKTFSKVFLVSLKDIKKGDEIYCSYGYGYWRAHYEDLKLFQNGQDKICTVKVVPPEESATSETIEVRGV